MTIRRFTLAAALVAALLPALASAATDPLSYDDPGMHFRPPDGWARVSQEALAGADTGGGHAPAAAYLLRKGNSDIRNILITIDSFSGDVDMLERAHESELRKAHEGTFIDKHEKTTLPNGMPAYWLRTSEGASIGNYVRRYEWVVADGTRSIFVAYVGQQGTFDEKEAREALSSLYVVAFPRRPRSSN